MTDVRPAPDAYDPPPGFGVGNPAYRLLLRLLRVAWASCALGVVAMLPALVLRSPALVVVYRAGLLVALAALAGAAVVFLGLVTVPHPAVRPPLPGGAARRAELLVAAVLADLLDPE